MKFFYRLLSTAQRIIPVASASDRVNIPNTPPPAIHRFLYKRNPPALQADFFLTYAGHNLYPQDLLYQALLEGHILPIPYPDAPTGISPLISPLESYGLENAHKCAIWIQVLLEMGQDHLSK